MAKPYDYLLLGGGTSCGYAAAAIRDRDKNGSIGIVSADNQPPYDRPPLSKGFLKNPDLSLSDIHSKDESFYPDNGIELHLGVRCEALDRSAKSARLSDGSEVSYGKLLYALGSTPRRLDYPGSQNAVVLRTGADGESLRAKAPAAKSVVIVGAGYIGSEVSATLRAVDVEVTLLELGDSVMPGFPSKPTRAAVRDELERLGVHVQEGDTVVEADSTLVTCRSGRVISADLVLHAVGVKPNVELGSSAGLEVSNWGIRADSTLKTPDPSIWVAGDIAEYAEPITGRDYHAEHHLHAKWTGEHVGACMAGDAREYRKVPYFFSDVGRLSIILRGWPELADRSFVLGNLEEPAFSEVFVKNDGRVIGFVDVREDYKAQDPICDLFERLIGEGADLSSRLRDLENPSFDVLSLA